MPFKLEALRFLSSFVPANVAVFYTVDSGLNAIEHVLLGMKPTVNDPYRAYFHRVDPFHPRHFADSTTPLATVHDISGMRQFERSEYYDGFFRPLGLLYEAELFFRDAGRLVGGVSLCRTRAAGDFQECELSFLRRSHALLQESLCCTRMTPATIAPAARIEGLPALTCRERQVVELVCRGATNAEIAQALFIELPTVKTHLQHIFAKADVRSRTELVAMLNGAHRVSSHPFG